MPNRADPPSPDPRCAQPDWAGPDVLIARVAHAMRDTLHALTGHAELLAATPLDPDQRRHVDAIGARVRYLRDLVAAALDGGVSARGAPAAGLGPPRTAPRTP